MPIIPEIDPTIDAAYDDLADVLYLSVGPPQACSSEEEPLGCLIRRSVSDGEVSGLTLVGFRDWFIPNQVLSQLKSSHRLPESLLRFLARLAANPELLPKYAFKE
jgi:hypothetical protein